MTNTIFKGTSSNNVLRKFADDLHNAFIYKGQQSVVLDLTDDKVLQTVINNEFLSYATSVITFNSLLGDAYSANTDKPLFADLPIPYIGWLVDDPIYHLNRLKPYIPKRFTLCPSDHHLKHLEVEKIQAKNSVLLAGTSKKESILDFKDRSIDILIAASFMGIPDLNINNFPEGVHQLLLAKTIDQLSGDKYVRVFDALLSQARRLGYDLLHDPNYPSLAMHIHLNERKKDRLNIIKAITESGLNITIIGKGWEEVLPNLDNLKFINEVNAEELDDFVSKSKLVLALNSSNGACERVFNAMSYGCCVLGDFSTTLEALLKDGKDIVFYEKNNFKNLKNKLNDLLNSNMAESIASRGLKKVESSHLWTNRVDELIKISS
jgi:glycosyltransferase involved in cell wall biosynthesis